MNALHNFIIIKLLLLLLFWPDSVKINVLVSHSQLFLFFFFWVQWIGSAEKCLDVICSTWEKKYILRLFFRLIPNFLSLLLIYILMHLHPAAAGSTGARHEWQKHWRTDSRTNVINIASNWPLINSFTINFFLFFTKFLNFFTRFALKCSLRLSQNGIKIRVGSCVKNFFFFFWMKKNWRKLFLPVYTFMLFKRMW